MGKTKGFEVVVNQVPGSITWNFEELKQNVSDKLSVYRKMQYSDDNIADAKKDLASLRKLSKAVNDKKIDIKKECLEPYENIEKQAKELIALIDEPIGVISDQIQEYETRRKEAARKAIYEYMGKAFEEFDEVIKSKASEAVYDTRWENATAKKTEWKKVVDDTAQSIRSDLEVINGIEEEFTNYAVEEYKRNLKLSDAMTKVQEMRKQKEDIIKRQKEEARRKEERRRQEELREAEPKAVQEQSEAPKQVYEKPEVTAPHEDHTTQTCAHNTVTDTAPDGDNIYSIQIKATPEQYKKVTEYIHFVGAKYRECGCKED